MEDEEKNGQTGNEQDELWSVERAMNELGVEKSELERLVSRGKLRAYRFENEMMFRREDVTSLDESGVDHTITDAGSGDDLHDTRESEEEKQPGVAEEEEGVTGETFAGEAEPETPEAGTGEGTVERESDGSTLDEKEHDGGQQTAERQMGGDEESRTGNSVVRGETATMDTSVPGSFRDELITGDARLTDLEEMSRTRSVLLHRRPRFISATIYALFLLLVAAVAWSIFGKLDVVVRANGFVRPEKDPVPVHTREGGKIKSVHADVGDRVNEGDVLVRFKTRDLRNELEKKKQSLKSEKQKIETYRSLRKQLRSEIDLQREWTEDRKNTLNKIISNAEDRLERYKTLRDKETISKEKYEQVLQDMRQKKLELQRLNEKRKERIADIKKRLRELSVNITTSRSRIDELNTEIDDLTARLDEQEVVAPRDGVIIHGDPQAGQVVSGGARLFEIASTDVLRVDLFVSEHNRNRIENGQEARLRVNAFPHFDYGTLTGNVYYISPDLQSPDRNLVRSRGSGASTARRIGNQTTGYRVKVRIKEGSFRDRLKPGMAVQAELKTEERRIVTVLFRKVRGAISFWDEPR